ncbi:MAG: thiol peroxidase [Candidatus Eremiobacteraeota bacterium]|nr:thiol peroxidase [Candidatus Eremiobacteraeota bacterium]
MERKNVVTLMGNPMTLVGPELKVGDRAPSFTVLDTDLKEKSLKDYEGKVKILSVTPSLNTPVCELQAKRFNKEAAALPGDVAVLNISVDLPFALKAVCAAQGIDRVMTLSDHRDVSFGTAYGVLMKEPRLLARAIFIIDRDDVIRYIEVVPEITSHPDYEKALNAAKDVMGVKA